MLIHLKLALRFLWRDILVGEWWLVFLAIFLAVVVTTTIYLFTDRLSSGLLQQGAKFLGGDIVVTSSEAIPSSWINKAKSLNLKSAQVWTYPSVISVKDKLQLVNVQAVSETYPLMMFEQSPLKINSHAILVEPRLLSILNIRLKAKVNLGAAQLVVADLLTPDRDSLSTGWAIAPRIMMRLADVPTTQTVVAGSRVDYRLLIVGDKAPLNQFMRWLQPQLKRGQRILTSHNQPLLLKNILENVQLYLQLIILISLLMSGVVIALSMQQYLRRHYNHVTLWRCLGATQNQMMLLLSWQLAAIAIAASIIGILTGFGMQMIFAYLFKNFLFDLPAPGYLPLLIGFITGVFLAFAFAYSLIIELPKTQALAMWQHKALHFTGSQYYFILPFLILSLFVIVLMKFSSLSLLFIDVILLSIGLLYGLSLFCLKLIEKTLFYLQGVMRRGLSELLYHSSSFSLQFICFNLILIALLVLGLVQHNLVQKWQASLPTHTPNYFIFNVESQDLSELRAFFRGHEVQVEDFYPIVRGRLISLNGQPIMRVIPPYARMNNALHRELNLSWMYTFPSDNKIVSGNWQPTPTRSELSIEKELAEDLNLKIGDRLGFQIGAQTITGTIANFRELDWRSFHPNFFVIFSPHSLDEFPATYIASFYLPASKTIFLNQLVSRFPSITIIDVANLVFSLQQLVAKIIIAIQLLFLFVLLTSFLIFIASLHASMDERKETQQLLRTLGASKAYVRNSLLIEFGSLFAVTILSSCSFALIITYLLERSIYF